MRLYFIDGENLTIYCHDIYLFTSDTVVYEANAVQFVSPIVNDVSCGYINVALINSIYFIENNKKTMIFNRFYIRKFMWIDL